MAERLRVDSIQLDSTGNITTEGVFQPATGGPTRFKIEAGVVSVAIGNGWRRPTPMDQANITRLVQAEAAGDPIQVVDGRLVLQRTTPPPVAPVVARAARRTASAVAAVSAVDGALDSDIVGIRSQIQDLQRRLQALLASDPTFEPEGGRAATLRREGAVRAGRELAQRELATTQQDAASTETQNVEGAERAQVALHAVLARLEAIYNELNSGADAARRAVLTEEARTLVDETGVQRDLVLQARQGFLRRNQMTPGQQLVDSLDQRARTAEEAAVRLRAEIEALGLRYGQLKSSAANVNGTDVPNVLNRLSELEKGVQAARSKAVRTVGKKGESDAADREREVRRAAEKYVDGLAQNLPNAVGLAGEMEAIRAELARKVPELEAAITDGIRFREAINNVQNSPTFRTRAGATDRRALAARMVEVERQVADDLQGAQAMVSQIRARLGSLDAADVAAAEAARLAAEQAAEAADRGRTHDARDQVENLRNSFFGNRARAALGTALGAVVGAPELARNAWNARQARKEAEAPFAAVAGDYDMTRLIATLRQQGTADADIRDALNRQAHGGVEDSVWAGAVDYAFVQADQAVRRREQLRNAGQTLVGAGRRGVDFGMRVVGSIRGGYNRLGNALANREAKATLAALINEMRGRDPRPSLADIRTEIYDHHSAGYAPADFDVLAGEAFLEANRLAMLHELPELQAHNHTRPQMVAHFIHRGYLPHNVAEANARFNQISRWPRFTNAMGKLKNFLFGAPGTTHRNLVYGAAIAGVGVPLAAAGVLAGQVVELGTNVVKGAGRALGSAGTAAAYAPETVTGTFKHRTAQALSTWNIAEPKKEEVKKEDGFFKRWGKRFRNSGKSLAYSAKWLARIPGTPLLTVGAALTSPFEAAGRSVLGLNPAGKHDDLTTSSDDHLYRYGVRGGLIGALLGLRNSAVDEKKGFVEATQVGVFKGAFKKTDKDQGTLGKIKPDVFSWEVLHGLYESVATATFVKKLIDVMLGKHAKPEVGASGGAGGAHNRAAHNHAAPAAGGAAARPAAAPAAAPAGAGGAHAHDHAH